MTNPNPESALEEFDVDELLVDELEQDELAEARHDAEVYDEGDDWDDEDEDDDDWEEGYDEVDSPESFEDDGVFEQLETTQPALTMSEVLTRQDDVNAQLDELNSRIENLIAEFTGKKEEDSATREFADLPRKRAA